MSDELNVLLFHIDGHAETRSSGAGKEGSQGKKQDLETVADLNQMAEILSEKIEREAKKLVPPYVTVHATVQFDVGSILMTGTVALLSWAGGVVLDAAKEEMQQQLARLVKLAVQRAFSRFLSAENLHSRMGAMEISVTSQPLSVTPRPAQTVTAETARSAPRFPAAAAVYVSMGVIFILQLVLLLDRFFVIQLKP